MKRNLLIIILAALFAACVGIGSLYIFKSLDGKTPKPSKELLKCDAIPADTSGASAPNLPTNMIPVCYNSEKEIWVKADSSNSSSDNRWYSYNNKVWANAITVTSANREAYLNAQAGTQIPMEDISTMFVWIPRFKATGDTKTYNGTNDINNPFNITFVSNTTKAHNAFTFGTQELNGFWMGKFEISHTTLASTEKDNTLGCTTSTCSNANGIIIKPNVVSLRWNNVSNFFYGILSMKQNGNAFGFDNSIDTHMIKNNEWGAVAYLTQSIYGRCSGSTSCTEVGINNSSITTGGSDYATNIDQSTTGNIYGVYDMAGGSYDYVMGVYTDGTRQWSGMDSKANSGFTGCLDRIESNCSSTYSGAAYPDSKYYNSYTKESDYADANLQHAMVVSKGDIITHTYFVFANSPWFARGGYIDGEPGTGRLFHYHQYSGQSFDFISSRVVLVK